MVFVIFGVLIIEKWLDGWARSNPSSGMPGAVLAFFRQAVSFALVFWLCLMVPIITQRIQSVMRTQQEIRAEQVNDISFSSSPTKSDKQRMGLDRVSRFSR